jgi:hypothetical protein
MKPTVEQGLTARAVKEDDPIHSVINDELIQVLRSAREALNFTHRYKASIDTADSPSAYKTIWESEVPQDSTAGLVRAWVVGTDRTFMCTYEKVLAYIVSGGSPGLAGAATIFSIETNAAFDARIQIIGATNTIRVEVMDAGDRADFTVIVDVLEL